MTTVANAGDHHHGFLATRRIGNELRMHALVNRVIRKLLIAVVVLSLLGVTPLMAKGSVCNTMPCCARSNAVTAMQASGCCPVVGCAKTRQDQKSVVKTASARTKPASAVLTELVVPSAAAPLTSSLEHIPPAQNGHRRLALLSALLI
jgi:hypothetical protein